MKFNYFIKQYEQKASLLALCRCKKQSNFIKQEQKTNSFGMFFVKLMCKRQIYLHYAIARKHLSLLEHAERRNSLTFVNAIFCS